MNMHANKLPLSFFLLALAVLPSCRTVVQVDSVPRGAHVLVNGNDTGHVTPAKISVRELHTLAGEGPIAVEVRTDGYHKSPPQAVETPISVGKIVWSVIIPVPMLFINLGRGWRKAVPKKLMFRLSPAPSRDG